MRAKSTVNGECGLGSAESRKTGRLSGWRSRLAGFVVVGTFALTGLTGCINETPATGDKSTGAQAPADQAASGQAASGPDAAGQSGGAMPAAPMGTGNPGDPAAAPPGGNVASIPAAGLVKLSGKLTLPANAPAGAIQLDVNPVSPTGNKGPLYSARLGQGGPFTLTLPKSSGQVNLMIYVGVTGSDPGSVGPENVFSWGPMDVGEQDIVGIDINLAEAPGAPAAPSAGNTPANAPGAGGAAAPSGAAPSAPSGY